MDWLVKKILWNIAYWSEINSVKLSSLEQYLHIELFDNAVLLD